MSRRENRTVQEISGLSVGHSNNPDVAVLKVQVIAGLNLAKKDIFGLSDPYCTVKVFDGESRDNIIASTQTPVRKKTLNPQWGSTFHFRVDKVHHKLLFELYDENRLTRDDFLGEVELPLTDIPTESEDSDISYKEYLLQRRSTRSHVRGQLRLLLAFLQSDGEPENTQEGDENFIRVLTSESRVIEEPGWEAVNSNDPDLIRPHLVDRLQSRQSDTSADLPLPRNWEERQDANGRTFFLDHSTRTTHWERPNAIGEPPPTSDTSRGHNIRRHISTEGGFADSEEDEGEGRSSPLPPGWEERVADNGRTFYIDHNQHATTWTRPRGSSQCLTQISPPDSADDEETAVPSSTQRLHPDVPSAAEMPLPAGWAMQLAPNGRVFFIDHNTRNTSWVDPRIDVQQSSGPDLGPLPAGWEERVHTDGRIFFIDHNTQSTQWEDPRVQKMNSKLHSQAVPYSRDYKRKYDFFRSRLRKPVNVPNKYEIHVRRNNILEDSYRSILANVNNTDLLKTKLWIVFDGEVGLDYGGVSREFFFLLSKEIFNPYYGLFEYSATDNYTLQINPNSGLCNDEHLSYFKFIGRVAGMAVYHGKLLDAFFIRPFYKMMLHKSIVLADMESVDSEYFNSLKWLQMNDPEPLDLRFQVEEEAFGQVTSRVLKPGGEDIIVTEKNKQEYIDLVIKWRFVDRVGPQMKKFIEGFNDLIPGNLVRIFDERELEYLLCGLGEIDLEDWRRNTNYRGGYHDRHVVIQWFWKAVSTFDNEMRARLLQFATGTSRVPMNGFTELYGSNGPQKFTIERWGNAHSLPRAHTCFNRVDLPPYTSYHELREKLRLAVENTEGFEGVD